MWSASPNFQSCPFGKIEGPVWYAIYHHLPVVIGGKGPLYLSTNQWEKDIYTNFKTSNAFWETPAPGVPPKHQEVPVSCKFRELGSTAIDMFKDEIIRNHGKFWISLAKLFLWNINQRNIHKPIRTWTAARTPWWNDWWNRETPQKSWVLLTLALGLAGNGAAKWD